MTSQKNTFRKRNWQMGFLGFLGCMGFRYFYTWDPTDLSWFAFFAYFAYFWLGRIHVDVPDERYYDEVKEAKAFTLNVLLGEVALLFILGILWEGLREWMVVAVAICFASAALAYAIRLYYLEEK